ncbi:hypothetical protein EXIGLDRAFT_724186 [Exidia glandulosa HHB12029]|uniref:Uncharacterized protein n=1 Tax=Exidia glandulosa HHB12029 TaxID=1314781 RepID=A0A165EHQ9_EXIGL|nr:hypothetical protein EXIGLDRAFT_728389 [Exidia glandulosa HHB12029]KZV86962.1 hypothetical protein EXIGLDRAFT_724186 [Exidia glandulosa HHB12029]
MIFVRVLVACALLSALSWARLPLRTPLEILEALNREILFIIPPLERERASEHSRLRALADLSNAFDQAATDVKLFAAPHRDRQGQRHPREIVVEAVQSAIHAARAANMEHGDLERACSNLQRIVDEVTGPRIRLVVQRRDRGET